MKPKYELLKSIVEQSMMESLKEAMEKNPVEIRRCILAEVSVKKSEKIVGGIAFLGTNLETITIGTLQDTHERIYEGEAPGEVPCGISERIPEEVSE